MIVLVTSTLGGGEDGGSRGGSSPAARAKQEDRRSPPPKSYEVQSGDTLTSIAHETGVPVAVIIKLNPGVDPQILIAGERLKLK